MADEGGFYGDHTYFGSTQADYEFGFDVRVYGLDSFRMKLQRMIPEVREAIREAVEQEAVNMRNLAQQLASGKVLQKRTGRFYDSIKYDVKVTATSVMGHVYSDDPRAPIFDYGGVQAARDILPNAGQALRFLGGSALLNTLSLGTAGMVYAAVVHRPEVIYPKHSVIHEAFDEMEGDQVEDFGDGWSQVTGGLPQRIEAATRSRVFDTGQGF